MSELRLVLAPTVRWQEVADRLEAQGWMPVDEPTELPLVEGEPRWTRWERGRSRMHMRWHAPLSMRVLRFEGRDAARARTELAKEVDWLGIEDLRRLLSSPGLEALLLGLLSTLEMGAIPLTRRVERLTQHPDPMVAQTAERVLAELPERAQISRLALLEAHRQEHPDQSPWLLDEDDAGRRCQALRLWAKLAEPGPEADARLLRVLRDPHWEVRASALIATARLGSKRLLRELKAPLLPRPGLDGLDAGDCDWLHGIALACARELAGRPVLDDPVARHLRRLVQGEPSGRFDEGFRWVHSLSEPLEMGFLAEEPPPGVRVGALGCTLADSGIEVAWVGAVTCWLGGPGALRRVVPERDLWMTRRPLTQAQVHWASDPGAGARPAWPEDPPALLSLEQAQRVASALASKTGRSLRVPTALELERAARGSDARRYPWGNGLAANVFTPWGMLDPVHEAGTWTQEGGRALLRQDPRCAALGPPAERAQLRLVWIP